LLDKNITFTLSYLYNQVSHLSININIFPISQFILQELYE